MKHYGPHWETPTYPEVGDRGQVGYWDAFKDLLKLINRGVES